MLTARKYLARIIRVAPRCFAKAQHDRSFECWLLLKHRQRQLRSGRGRHPYPLLFIQAADFAQAGVEQGAHGVEVAKLDDEIPEQPKFFPAAGVGEVLEKASL